MKGVPNQPEELGDWKYDARCRNLDPDLFFPEGKGIPTQRKIKLARQVCATCPVRAECLDYALRTGQDFGVWGGTVPMERRDMRRIHSPSSMSTSGKMTA